MPGVERPTASMLTLLMVETCRVFDTTITAVKSKDRHKNIVMARHTITTLANLGLGCTLEAAGSLVNRGHCNVICSRRVVSSYYRQNKKYRDKVNQVISTLSLKVTL